MKRVFVFEYLTGGGPMPDEAEAATLLPLGLSMRDAMVGDLLLHGGFAVSAAVSARAPSLPPGAWGVQAEEGESMFDFVAYQALLHDVVWLVAPETGGLLAELQRAVPATRWLGCDADAVALASRKHATLQRLDAHGIATPLAFEHQASRWVVKPDDGAGGTGTRVFTRLADARADAAERSTPGAPMTLEPWVDGEPLSVSLMCGGGAEVLSINRQRIDIGADGWLAYRGVQVNAWSPQSPHGAVLTALAMQVAQAVPGLRGFAGIDLVWHPQRGPVVIELNPRVTCAYVGLSASLGRDLAGDLIERAFAPELADAL